MRFALETLAGIVGGLVGWLAVGLAAAQVLSAIYGDREGSAGMGGLFVIGPVGGVAGFALSLVDGVDSSAAARSTSSTIETGAASPWRLPFLSTRT